MLLATQLDFSHWEASGLFRRANIGNGSRRQVHDTVRRDDLFWLERDSATLAQQALWNKVESLQVELNQRLFLGINSIEAHYAIYSAGGFYRRHRDAFLNDDSRTVSLILYLNPAWKPADGGQLRIYLADGTHQDIAPVGGTMVCFMSREFDHEVMPSYQIRRSFAGWYKR